MASAKVTSLKNPDRVPLMVVSHERSGTHFVMNSIAACFSDYSSFPSIDIDKTEFNINYYHPGSLQKLILYVARARPANILKCHHEFEFFSEIIAAFKGALEIVYIHRNPADVMASYWRFLHTWPWTEGPRADTALNFAMTAPMGQLMRLQFRQYETMLDRWANHVRSWTEPRLTKIHIVRYEDLAGRYEDTIRDLGSALGLEPDRIVRPSRHENVIQQGPINFEPPASADNRKAITGIAAAKFPDLMARLGYVAQSDEQRGNSFCRRDLSH